MKMKTENPVAWFQLVHSLYTSVDQSYLAVSGKAKVRIAYNGIIIFVMLYYGFCFYCQKGYLRIVVVEFAALQSVPPRFEVGLPLVGLLLKPVEKAWKLV
jgi:hypothetical protein